jgi:hypothetical protein
MKTTLETCLMILAIGLPVHLLYWFLFRPIVLLKMKYRVFRARDELRALALRGEVSQKEKAFPILEQRCNTCIKLIGSIDMNLFVQARTDKLGSMEASKDLQLINEASADLRRIHRDITMATLGAAFANSPGAVALSAPFLALFVFALWFNRFKSACEDFLALTWSTLYLRTA